MTVAARQPQDLARLRCEEAPETEFVNLVKQTYRVLLTRGMKGCYVYFDDAATRAFLLSRMKAERASAVIEA